MRLLIAPVLLLAGCETTGRAERVESRQQELYEVTKGRPEDRQRIPMTARERNDPLLMDPQWLAKPEQPQR
mgnify:CR=1 FL=1